MDKKSIINDRYQAVVVNVLTIGYSMMGKKILKMTPPCNSEVRSLRHGKAGWYCCCIRDDKREYLIKQKILPKHNTVQTIALKMASIVMLIGGALVNALAFTSSSYMFSWLSKDSTDVERKRHGLGIEQLQKVWKRQEWISFINKQLRLETAAETKFTELNDTMRVHHAVFGQELSPLPRQPVLSDFYTPSNEQHERELVFIILSMTGIGGALWYLEGWITLRQIIT